VGDFLSMLQGQQGQQGPPPGVPHAIQIPGQAGDQPDQPSGPVGDKIKQALTDLRAIITDPGVSEQERLLLEKCTSVLQQIRATHEKEQQAALGGSPATNFLRRQSGG
jgi:hypothetical protein